MEQEKPQNKDQISESLYSRQMAVYGEAMGKLIQMQVFLYGLRGTGIETAKNLILAGPKKVVLCDPGLVEITDLGTNFYLEENMVGKKSRAECSLIKLKELNPIVDVSVYSGNITSEFLSNFGCVVFTDFYQRGQLLEISNYCHDKNIGFIYAGMLGLYGFCFVDFGETFKVFDKNGEECKSAIISNITNEEKAIVTCHEDKRHEFEDDDYVIFNEVQGMDEINGKTAKIKYLNPFSFQLELDTRNFKNYTREGLATQIKVPQDIHFRSLKDSLFYPYGWNRTEFDNPSLEKFGRPEQLHIALNSILDFVELNKQLPKLFDANDAQKCAELAKQWNESGKLRIPIEEMFQAQQEEKKMIKGLSVENVEEEIIKQISLFCRTQTSALASFWGGIVCQEIIKLTGKFTPLQQWLHFDTLEILPEQNAVRKLQNCRYDDQIALFGNDIHNRLIDQKIFLVGAGALGCEYLKLFALMGIASGQKGMLYVTDDDVIEMSNLNRQFLFKKNDIGKPKSERACLAMATMNKNINYNQYKLRVCPETEEFFNDNFWESLDYVVNGVDNIQARLFIDSRCVFYSKPLFESGTLGTKCNSQVIIPHETQSYGDSRDPPEKSIPLCTLKNFPYQIEHAIEWARDFFEGYFVDGPNECVRFLQDKADYLQSIKKEFHDRRNFLRSKLETIDKLANTFIEANYEQCLKLARQMFQDIFHNAIASLLNSFPLDHKTEQGQFFWSGPKRAPQIINFDVEDPWHFLFIKSAANILAYCFGLTETYTDLEIKNKVKQIKVAEFQPKKIQIKANEQDQTEEKAEDDDQVIDSLTQKLSSMKITTNRQMKNVEFEKDDDTNFHIDFIAATANLRARNYKIPEVDRFKVKLIAGKIIPAIATTTAMVVGAIGVELLRYAQGKKDFKNSFMNLALPLWVFSDPLPPIKNVDNPNDPVMMGPIKAIPPEFTSWDKLLFQGPLTLQQLLDQIKSQYKVDASIMSCGKLCVYNAYMNQQENKEKFLIFKKHYFFKSLSKNLEEIIESISGQKIPKHKKYLELEISGETLDGIDAITPTVVVRRFQK